MNEEKIAVSVIVPVYNVEKYLVRCLESLVNQTLTNIEIICINDGSIDNSHRILEEYAYRDKRVKVISQPNSGQSVARNKGIDIAKGEYIGFVDSDDWVSLDFFEKLYNSAIKHDADIACGEIIRLHKTNKKFHLKFEKEEFTNDTNRKFLLCDCPEKSYIWNKIYKTKSLQQSSLRFVEGMIFEDVIFTPQALYYLDKLVVVPDIYYYYWRRKQSTITLKDNKSKQDNVRANLIASKFIKEHNIDISKQEVKTYRFKICGITVFKTQTKNNKTKYILFNIFKFGKI